MSIVRTAAGCLLILGSLEAIIIAQWAQWSAHYRMWNHSISMLVEGTDTRAFGIWGYCAHLLKYQEIWSKKLHIKETVLCLWNSLSCIKIWIVIFYRRLKFPKQAVVILPLEMYPGSTKVWHKSCRLCDPKDIYIGSCTIQYDCVR